MLLKTLTLAISGVSLAIGASAATAQTFPERPITLSVPFATGGPTDILARVVARGLERHLGQPIVVDNKPGAGGRLGVESLKRTKPDGYTVGVATASTQGVAPNLYNKLTYDPLKDFRGVGQLVVAPGVMIANKASVPNCDMKEFIEKLKKNPGKYTYGSSGIGGLAHVTGEQFLAVTGTQMLHVPYKGLGPAMQGLYGGQVDVVFDNVSTSSQHIKQGGVCALAVQSDERLASLPDIPTYKELELDAMNTPTWYGLIVPAATPDDVVATLNEAVNKALADEDIVANFESMGVKPSPMSPKEFDEVQANEINQWAEIFKISKFEKLD